MQECISPYYFHNGKTEDCDRFDLRWVYEGESIYEVLRIQDGIPLFLEDHTGRLDRTADIRGMKLPADPETIGRDIYAYVRGIGLSEGNLKVVINRERGKKEHFHYLIYRIVHHYPTGEMYRNGVKCLLHYAERFQPEAKVINYRLRNTIYKRLIETSHYEALLVDRKGKITEGSRSNVFFIRGEILFTAPDSCVLPGISRSHVIQICKDKKVDLRMKSVEPADLGDFDAAFLTGTSIRILPVSRVETCTFDPGHSLLTKLKNEFDEVIKAYVRLRKIS
ncbi:MAG: aminotransferase class IV [Chlorobi bacterium]|nr:aminotransferase class IV [Chlorobiota bacterium]